MTYIEVKLLIRVIYAMDARMVIALNCDRDGSTCEAGKLFASLALSSDRLTPGHALAVRQK